MPLLKRLIAGRAALVAATLCLSIVSICISLLWNMRLSEIINAVNSAKLITSNMISKAIIAMLLSAASAYCVGIISGKTLENMAHDLRMGCARRITLMPLQEVEAVGAGQRVSMLQNEVNDVSGFLRANLFSIVDDIIKFVGTFAWLLWLNPVLILLAIAPSLLIMLYSLFSSKIISAAAAESQTANAKMTGFADTLITVFPALRLFGAEPLLRGKHEAALAAWRTATVKEERRKALLMSLSGIMQCLPMLMLLLIGGTQVINGAEDIGTLYIFINLSGNVMGVMMNMPGRIAGFRRFSVNMKRLEPNVALAGRMK